jgi:glycosyltransferase involved in cell wall biosynthesis
MDVNVFRKKGLDRLLPAFKTVLASVSDARLDVIGRGSPEVMAEVSGLIEQLQLGAQVTLCGPMPNDELLARLPGYAVFVLPSHNETFGMSYVEALLAGCPSSTREARGSTASWTMSPPPARSIPAPKTPSRRGCCGCCVRKRTTGPRWRGRCPR